MGVKLGKIEEKRGVKQKHDFGYHPQPVDVVLKGEQRTWSTRRVEERYRAILNHVPLEGRSVLDLGCSGGYFGFKLANVVGQYYGVDGNIDLVERNRKVAQELGLINLFFKNGQITPGLIDALPRFDIALFLSVFHHMLTSSEAYEFNRGPTGDAWAILRVLAKRVDVLVFEVGYPDEGHEWCPRLPPMPPNPRVWVRKKLLESGFDSVEIVSAPAYQGVRGRLRAALGELVKSFGGRGQGILGRVLMRIFRTDLRDGRDLFIARSKIIAINENSGEQSS